MSTISVDYDVLNQRGSPAWFSDTFANIPTAGFKGRMFISTDTFAFYRDTGTGWDLIGGPGIGTLTGSGVAGQVSFFSGTQVLAGNNNLFWDNVNSRLGIGTITPGAPLDIHATGTNAQFNGTGTSNAYITFQNAGVSKWRIGNTYSTGSNFFEIYSNNLSSTALSIQANNNIFFYSGIFSTAGSISLRQNINYGNSTGYLTLNARSSGATETLAISCSSGFNSQLIFTNSANYDYTFPATTGTIALTSNLSSYVPYTGATGQLDLGLNDLSARYIFAEGGGGIGPTLGFKQTSFGAVSTTNHTNIYVQNNNIVGFTFYQVSAATKTFAFDVSGIDETNTRTLTIPNASGTLALTSNLSSYLPLTGGTLTGQLYINPTNASVTGLDVASNTIRFRSDNLEGFKRQLNITMGSGTLVQFAATGFGGSYNTELAFYTSSTSGVNASPGIYITGNSNCVGIGTGSPVSKLTIQAPASANPNTGGLSFNLSNNTTYFTIGVNVSSGDGALLAGSGGAIRFYTDSDMATTNERMRLLNTGPLVINTTTSTASMNQTGILQVNGGIRSTSGLLTIFELGTIPQNTTITQAIAYNGLYLITNGGNNSALFMITRAGGSRGCQLVSSTNNNLDIVCGTTTEPVGGTYLRLWMDSVGVLSIKNVSAYTGPYSMNPIASQ